MGNELKPDTFGITEQIQVALRETRCRRESQHREGLIFPMRN